MAGGLALVCAFCQWKIEHKESECGGGLIPRHMAGHERDGGRFHESIYKKRMKKHRK